MPEKAGEGHAHYIYQNKAQQGHAPEYINGRYPLRIPNRIHDRSCNVIGEVCHSTKSTYLDKDMKNQLYRRGAYH